MPDAGTLYDQDFYRWTQEQAGALRDAARERSNTAVDWSNVAEEIEDLGRSRRSELRSRLQTIIEHLLKLEFSPATDPRRGWHETVLRERNAIADILDENPSLRREVDGIIGAAAPRTAQLTATILLSYGELSVKLRPPLLARRYTPAEIQEDWFPPDPAHSPD